MRLSTAYLYRGAFLLFSSNACPNIGQRTRLPELRGGEFNIEEDRSVLLFSNPAELMSIGGHY